MTNFEPGDKVFPVLYVQIGRPFEPHVRASVATVTDLAYLRLAKAEVATREGATPFDVARWLRRVASVLRSEQQVDDFWVDLDGLDDCSGSVDVYRCPPKLIVGLPEDGYSDDGDLVFPIEEYAKSVPIGFEDDIFDLDELAAWLEVIADEILSGSAIRVDAGCPRCNPTPKYWITESPNLEPAGAVEGDLS